MAISLTSIDSGRSDLVEVKAEEPVQNSDLPECVICLNPISRAFNNLHAFHAACLQPVLNTGQGRQTPDHQILLSCPSCRGFRLPVEMIRNAPEGAVISHRAETSNTQNILDGQLTDVPVQELRQNLEDLAHQRCCLRISRLFSYCLLILSLPGLIGGSIHYSREHDKPSLFILIASIFGIVLTAVCKLQVRRA